MSDTKEENREGYARRTGALDGVKSEPRTYGPGGTHSFFRDLAISSLRDGSPASAEAWRRITRHRTEVDGEIRDGSEEGRRARATILRDGAEQRAGTSTTIAGFTTPQYLTEYFAEYRSAQRTFTDCTELHPLDGFGLQINVPSFSGATPAGQQTEGSGINQATPSGSNLQASVQTVASGVALSQQLYDQGGMSGLSFDKILAQQLKYGIDAQVDTYVIKQTTGGITAANNTVTDNSAFSIPLFYEDVATARESLADLVGTRLKATHIFTLTDAFGYITRAVDATTNRPVFTPDWAAAPLVLAPGDEAGDGWTGHVLPSKLAWFTDDNIPNLSGNYQLLVSRPSSVLTFESDFIPFAYPETGASTLSVFLGVRKYVCSIARFPNAHAVVTGSAYATTEV